MSADANREAGIISIIEQFNKGEILTQNRIDAMADNRRKRGIPEEAIQQELAELVPGQSRFIYYMCMIKEDDGKFHMQIVKLAVATIHEAVTKIEAVGAFVEMSEVDQLPRLRAW